MDYKEKTRDFVRSLEDMNQAQTVLHDDLLSMDAWLNKSLENLNAENSRLKEKLAEKGSRPLAGEGIADQIEKLLQGSLDALGDKLSDKILGMMQEMKTMSGPMRVQMMGRIKAAADAEMVDLSTLFGHEDIKSNIEDIGVDETETKSIDKSLEKLRKLRGQ